MGFLGLFKKDKSPSPDKLLKAARKGNVELVDELLGKGTDVNCRDEKGWTPLLWACVKDQMPVIKTVLGHGGNIHTPNNDGNNALMLASANGRVETVKMLLEAGARIGDKNNEGHTALDHAFGNGWLETVKLLMDAGAEPGGNDKEQIRAFVNGPSLPSPETRPPWPEFARKHDLSLDVEVKKSKAELVITADNCMIDWGDESGEDEYAKLKEKKLTHRYRKPGNYTITVDASGLSCFECHHIDSNVTALYLNHCPQLEYLTCYLNKIEHLDVSRCPALLLLSCSHNQLTSLDLGNNPKLEYLSCEKNLLTCLDMSKNPRLTDLNCADNQLSILNITRDNGELRHLRANGNQLSKDELNRIFNHLPNYNSSYGTVNSWYAGQTTTPDIFFACAGNPGFSHCNTGIAARKNWLIWKKAMYIPATLAGTPGRWQEDFR